MRDTEVIASPTKLAGRLDLGYRCMKMATIGEEMNIKPEAVVEIAAMPALSWLNGS